MSRFYDIFACPLCGQPLVECDGSLGCKNRHSFDISAGGYANLLVSNKTGSGDSAAMILARHRFLRTGYYDCFKNALARLLIERLGSQGGQRQVIDAGCGEGYYTEGVFDGLNASGIEARAAGFDISKPAIKTAAKQSGKVIAYAVASLYRLPVIDCCADAVINVFAPVSNAEFKRVLKAGGWLVIAAPGKRHLFGIKEVLYESPYENEENNFTLEGFEPAGVEKVGCDITLTKSEDIRNLLMMTPYYWKSPAEGVRRLNALETLNSRLEFEFFIFKRS